MDVQADGGRGDGKRRGARIRVDEPQAVLRGKHTLVLTDEAWERLSVYAIKTKADCSELVEGLINSHLRGFVVQDRRATPLPARLADPAAEANGTVEDLPISETLTPSDPPVADPIPGAGEEPKRRGRATVGQTVRG